MVTRFYHSVICPRCGLANLWLASLLSDFPDVVVEKVEFLTHRAQAREAGVKAIPTMVSGTRRLGGFLLTRGAIRTFLESLDERHVTDPLRSPDPATGHLRPAPPP